MTIRDYSQKTQVVTDKCDSFLDLIYYIEQLQDFHYTTGHNVTGISWEMEINYE